MHPHQHTIHRPVRLPSCRHPCVEMRHACAHMVQAYHVLSLATKQLMSPPISSLHQQTDLLLLSTPPQGLLLLTTERASLLSAKNRGSIAWKDSSVRPVSPVMTWGLCVIYPQSAAAVGSNGGSTVGSSGSSEEQWTAAMAGPTGVAVGKKMPGSATNIRMVA